MHQHSIGNEKHMKQVDIADLDCIYLSYDEPQREEFWVRIQNMIPWARRVDGIRGSDSAHKAAAQASITERFILIDGDNMPSEKFFNLTFEFPDNVWEGAVYRWRAQNHINGLMYGNGGLSSWTREFVKNMRTHENTDGREESQIEFCFEPNYWAMHDCYSITYPNASAFQAWRAGFREGVKMCLVRGARPNLNEFRTSVHQRNLDHLTIWHNVGRDVENGIWAIAGSRMGTYMTMLTAWDYRQVQDWDALNELWLTVKDSDPELLAGRVAEDLVTQLDLPINRLGESESAFFKLHYKSGWQNLGVMIREMDVIRKQEGW
jgi:hypothetical protein